MIPRILVVDDEASIRSLLTRVLNKEGLNVLAAATGQEGLDAAIQHRPDLIVLDLNLPDLYGEDVCKKIRQNSSIESIPVLILTGKNSEGLPARCLDGGADDYLSKPFDVKEFIARIRALLRRAQGLVSGRGMISKGRISIRVAERMVLWRGHRIDTLAPKEFDMLRLLVLEAPKVVDKTTMAIKAWGLPLDQVHQRTLDVHIRRIRKKLGPTASSCLKTVPSIGFQWLDETVPADSLPAAHR